MKAAADGQQRNTQNTNRMESEVYESAAKTGANLKTRCKQALYLAVCG